jgi:KipI family sensor histidine kinase inhibitor
MLRIVPLGDKAVLAEFSEALDLAVNARIQHLAKAIQARRVPGLRDVVPALASLALHFDRSALERGGSLVAITKALIDDCLREAPLNPRNAARSIEIPVCYEAEFGADLAEVAKRCKLATEEVVHQHAGSAHRVLMMGFVPGHPYIGNLDGKLSVPRRATPRQKVATGTIAIANAQTVIYPYAMSSGWNLIGRTPLRIFDAAGDPPCLMNPGDRVRFSPIRREEFERIARAQR